MDRRGLPFLGEDPFDLSIDGPSVAAEIGEHGEWDEFHFWVERESKIVVETEGPTDVVMALAGPDDPEAIVAQDDDGGESYNARVETVVVPGSYVVRVCTSGPPGPGSMGSRSARPGPDRRGSVADPSESARLEQGLGPTRYTHLLVNPLQPSVHLTFGVSGFLADTGDCG